MSENETNETNGMVDAKEPGTIEATDSSSKMSEEGIIAAEQPTAETKPSKRGHHGHGKPASKDKDASIEPSGKKEHFGWIMALYLIGLFLGSLTMGVITPVRPIIQTSLGVDAATGIWMINIFTLMYAAVIPISGKLADRHGRKIVFLISIIAFAIGSLICGLSNTTGSFVMLLVGRVIQGLGAGGIMPIATAEFGTSFPPEKRGMALGLVGGVYGIGSVLGATVGSAIVSLFGAAQWQWVFYLNIPVCVFIVVFGLIYIPNHKAEQVFKIDKLGTLLMVVIIISLLYGLKNIDFFDFINSFTQWQAWVFILLAVVLIPLFVFVEKRAEDPIFHIEYMSNSQIVVTLLIGLLVGMVMMGMVFIPQFAENALKMSSGAGGYFVIVLGLMAGVVSPVSGVLVDKFGEKGVMLIGLVISAAGSFFLAFVAVPFPNLFTVIFSLALIGLGMGFTMGTPLNYMMMANTKEEESNSALATLSLVRSIGTAIAPALMVGFIIQAAGGLQTQLMEALPEVDSDVEMSQTSEIRVKLDELVAVDDELQALIATMDTSSMEAQGVSMGSSQSVREKLADMDIDSMLDMSSDMNMDMNMDSGDMTMPDELLDKMQNSDVTTIVAVTQELVDWVFSEALGDVQEDIKKGIQEGADGIGEGITGIQSGINGIQSGISSMSSSMSEMRASQEKMAAQKAELEQGVAGATIGLNAMKAQRGKWLQEIEDLKNQGYPENYWEIQMKRAQIDAIENGEEGIKATEAAITQMQQGAAGIQSGIDGIQSGLDQMSSAQGQMSQAVSLMNREQELMGEIRDLMLQMKDDVPGLFQTMKADYKKSVDENSNEIETVYQTAINQGYRNMYILVGCLSIIALILLMFYRQPKRNPESAGGHGHGHGHGHGKKAHGHGHGKDGQEATLDTVPTEA